MATVGVVKAKGLGSGLQGGFAFHGADEMWRQLGELTGSIQRKYVRQGVAAGGRVLIKEMKRRAPRGDSARKHSRSQATKLYANAGFRGGLDKKGNPKKLWKSITQRPSSQWPSASEQARRGNIATAVGPTWPEGAHAHLLEFGHKLIAWGKETGKRVAPRPFMRPALDASRGLVLAAQQLRIHEGLTKEADKMRAAVDGAK